MFIKKFPKQRTKEKAADAVARSCSVKNGVLKNFANNHRKRSVPGSLLNNIAGRRLATLSLRYRCFPVNLAKISGIPIF